MSEAVKFALFRERLGYQPLLLGGVALIASVALAVGNLSTSDAIAARQAEDLNRILAQVVPAETHDNDLVADARSIGAGGEARTVYFAKKADQITGMAFQTIGHGYAGDIAILMAVDVNGKILGVRVLSHKETPGLGDKIEVKKGPWIRSFDGRSLEDPATSGWAVKKDGGIFDQFTGATITPRGVVKAVHEGLQFFTERRAEMLEPAPAAAVTEEAGHV